MPHRLEPSTLPAPLSGARATYPAGLDPAAADAQDPLNAPLSVPLGSLALLFVVVSVGLAALLGYGLAAWAGPMSPWMVALASGVGVMCTALPLGLALFGLGRKVSRQPAAPAQPTPEPAVPAAGAGAGALGAAGGAGPVGGPAVGAAGAAERGLPQGLVLGREHFMDMVAREWSRARRYGTGAALLLVEIDRHSRLVDALGDAAGDKVLAEIIAGTAPTLRGADALTRHESGQIAVFLAHADATGALDVAERIRERAEQMEVAVPPRRVRFTVSVGVAHLRPAHLHLQALVDDVADALAAARTAGGNCVRAAPVDFGQRPTPGAARDGSRADKK